MEKNQVIEQLGTAAAPLRMPRSLDYSCSFAPLIEFASGAQVPNGFGYLTEDGQISPDKPAELWITCRMTHLFSLAHLLGFPGADRLARHGVESLAGPFHDQENGGWFSAVATSNPPGSDSSVEVVDDAKASYAHAFVLLAANSAVAAGIDGAEELLAAALESQDEHWFDPESGKVRESWDRTFSVEEDYRGINANMHTVEAYLAVADLTGNQELLDRAVGILHFVAGQAGKHDWRIPEHFTADWQVVPDYNEDQPAHPFRPFGVTPGHGLEWSRLMLQARQSVIDSGNIPEQWMLPAAVELYERAVTDGWNVDGAPGFVYTTDFEGNPVVTQRMHWVLCEAVAANVVLSRALASGDYPGAAELRNTLQEQLEEWGEYAGKYLEEAPGRWHHELDGSNDVAAETWPGKPDAYHLAQMLLLPLLPVSPAFAAALKEAKTRAEGPAGATS